MPIDDELPPLFGGDLGSPLLDGDPGLPTVLRAGYQIGNRYTLGRPLGRGGFGALWTARDEQTKERVAVKVLQAVPKDDDFQEAATRLRREARAYQKLNHPAVTKLRNVGTTDQGEPYIVLELLKGTDLAGKLGGEAEFAPAAAVELLLPIADALAEAHENDLVHRDVKLGNIFLAEQPDGTIATKLIDFGLTKQLDAIAAQSLTGAGVRIGSPSYMSPEQARGGEVDPRSDVWGFCVVLYRMVAGRLPFVAETYIQQRKAIIENKAPSFEALGVHEPALWAIVEHGLEKAPGDRWHSMRFLADALREWLATR